MLIGRFASGTCKFVIHQCEGLYVGEVDVKGKAHGEGTFTNGSDRKYKGYFRENQVVSYCK